MTVLLTGPASVATATVAALGITQGLLILLANPARWGAPSFTIIRQLPGAPYTWGIWAATAGTLIAVGLACRLWIAKAVGLVALGIWAGVFGVGALVATIQIRTVPTTGGPTYLALSVLIFGLVHYRSPDERR